MDKKKIIVILSAVLLIMGIWLVSSVLKTPVPTGAPINTLFGIIKNKGQDNFTIVQYDKTYKVRITDKTIITGQIPSVPQAFLSLTPPQPKKLSMNDLKDGQEVSVNTLTDLRDDKITKFETTSIRLPQVITTLSGTLVDIKGSNLFLKTYAFRDPGDLKDAKKAASLPLEKTYTVKTNKNTGFFLELKKIGFSDLKKNAQITVYSPTEITGKEDITAQYVEVLPPPLPAAPNNPVAPPPPSSSANAK